MLLGAGPMDFLDITDYDLVEEVVDDEAEAGSKPQVPNAGGQLTSQCTGIVVHSLFGGQQQGDEVRGVLETEGMSRSAVLAGSRSVPTLSHPSVCVSGGCAVTQQKPSTH